MSRIRVACRDQADAGGRDEIMLGTSYSERKVAENERYFKILIERTEGFGPSSFFPLHLVDPNSHVRSSSDLIDISQNIAALEGQEAIERARDYRFEESPRRRSQWRNTKQHPI